MRTTAPLVDIEIYLDLLKNGLNFGREYHLKSLNCENLICYAAIMEGQDLIVCFHMHLQSLNFMLTRLKVTQEPAIDVPFNEQKGKKYSQKL